MSLTKILKAPLNLFKKDVITFVIIRRYDLGILDDKLRYIAVRPSASISVLRQKIWHLLDLPDFCEEIIVLKSGIDKVIQLTELRKGNDPQHPYILEVWLPGNRFHSSTTVHNRLLTIENGEEHNQHGNDTTTDTIYESKQHDCIDNLPAYDCSASTISNETMALNKFRVCEDKIHASSLLADFKKSDLMAGVSSSSLFRVHRRKSRDNFTNIFLKIQSDLSTLNNKLTTLENKIID